MTNDKFRTLCEQVLIPRMGDLLHHQLVDILETQNAIAAELIRLGALMERAAAGMTPSDDAARK